MRDTSWTESYIKPMLAKTLTDKKIRSEWLAEQKYDGHRHLVQVIDGGVHNSNLLRAWSSGAKDAKHKMDNELQSQVLKLIPGVYDGELHLGTGRSSSDVSKLDNKKDLIFTIFDCLIFEFKDLRSLSLSERKEYLNKNINLGNRIEISPTKIIYNKEELDKYTQEIWSNGGEGIILKRLNSPYKTGRTDYWFKLKQTQSAVLVIVKYRPPSKGTGEFGTVRLQDEDGNFTYVRIPTLEEKDRCLKEDIVGRKLRIDYQQKTNAGSYRHPVWDRFEDE